jgi:retinol dehydrogenase-14
MCTYELAKLLEGTGVTVNIVEPGFVATNLGRNSGSLLLSLEYKMMRPIQISAKKGTTTSVYLASAPEVEGVTGKRFYRHRETETSTSYDQQRRRSSWDVTVNLLGLASTYRGHVVKREIMRKELAAFTSLEARLGRSICSSPSLKQEYQ